MNNRVIFFSFLTIVLISIVFPVLSIFLLLIMLLNYNKYIGKTFLFLFVSLLCLINTSKIFENDIVWYYDHYLWLQKNSLLIYFDQQISGVYAKITEPVIYLIFKFIGCFFGDNKYLFVIFFTLLSYILLISSSNKIFNHLDLNKKYYYAGIIFILSFGFTFTLSIHLIRQFVAQAFLLFAISLFFCKKKIKFLLFIILSFLTHNSVIYVVFILILAYLISNMTKIRYFVFNLFSLTFVFFLSKFFLTTSFIDRDGYINKDDGQIAISVFVMDFLIFLFSMITLLLVRNKSKNLIQFSKFSASLYVLYAFALLGFLDVPLIFLRFGFFMELIRVLLLCILFKNLSEIFKYNAFSTLIIFLLGIFYLYLRLESSEFTYLIDFSNTIFLSMWDIL